MITNYLKTVLRKASLIIYGLCSSLMSFGQEVEWVVEPKSKYGYVGKFENGTSIIKLGGKYGLISRNGQVLLKPEYNDISKYQKGLLSVEKSNKIGLVDSTGKTVLPLIYTTISTFKDGMAILEKDGKFGYIDNKGKIKLPLIYSQAYSFNKETAFVKLNSNYCFIDNLGKVKLTLKQKNLTDLEIINDVILARKDTNTLIIDYKGEVLSKINGRYQCFILSENCNCGYTSEQIKEHEDFIFIKDLRESGTSVDDVLGFFCISTKTYVKPQYSNIGLFCNGISKINWNQYINNQGEKVIDPDLIKYRNTFCESKSEGFAFTGKEFINIKTNNIIKTPLLKNAGRFSNGRAAVLLENTSKWGFINKEGKLLIENKYDYVKNFEEGLCIVNENGVFTIIDTLGKNILKNYYKKIEFNEYTKLYKIFDETDTLYLFPKNRVLKNLRGVSSFSRSENLDRLSLIKIHFDDNTTGIMDEDGNQIVINKRYSYINEDFSEGLTYVYVEKSKKKYGFIDKTGKEIIPPQFEEVTSFSEGLAWVKLNGKWGIIKNPLLKKEVTKPTDTQAPTITINSPKNAQERSVGKPIFTSPTLTLQGQITDNEKVTAAWLNGQTLALQADGSFSQSVPLTMGTNSILIEATDAAQNRGTFRFEVERRAEATVSTAFGTYHALLIAAKDYKNPSITDLTFPVSDAQKLKEVLVNQYAFAPQNVKLLPNPTRSELLAALGRYSEQLTDKDNLLIFYAGHGEWDAKLRQGYWLLADANANEIGNWFSNADLKTYLGGISTKHTLLISDACFSGSIFQGRSNAPNRAVTALASTPSRRAMTSGTLKTVPDESVFMRYLLKRLNENSEPYLSAQSLFSSFKEAVINNLPAGSNLIPQYGVVQEAGDEGGDFVFVKK